MNLDGDLQFRISQAFRLIILAQKGAACIAGMLRKGSQK